MAINVLRKIPAFSVPEVYLPSESFGNCLRSRYCKQFEVVLADGFCVRCWDKGQATRYENRWGQRGSE